MGNARRYALAAALIAAGMLFEQAAWAQHSELKKITLFDAQAFAHPMSTLVYDGYSAGKDGFTASARVVNPADLDSHLGWEDPGIEFTFSLRGVTPGVVCLVPASPPLLGNIGTISAIEVPVASFGAPLDMALVFLGPNGERKEIFLGSLDYKGGRIYFWTAPRNMIAGRTDAIMSGEDWALESVVLYTAPSFRAGGSGGDYRVFLSSLRFKETPVNP